MCRILRHTTLLLSGMTGLEGQRVKMTKQDPGLLFTGAEIWVKLAWCSCSNSWTKPLQTFVNVVEECLIFNFASDPKVQFSLKNWRKTISKIVQRNPNRPGTPERAHVRRRARVPRQRPYARRAHAEAPADPAVHAPHRSATVGDDREWLDGARSPASTRRRANRGTPLAAAPLHVATPCCPRRTCTGDVVDPTTS
jgi:hypothetical protein